MKTVLTIESTFIEKMIFSFKSRSLHQLFHKKENMASKKQEHLLRPYSSDFISGIDPTKLNQLADELEMQEQIKALR